MPRKIIVTPDPVEVYEPEDDTCKRPAGPRCDCGCRRSKRECEAMKRMRENPENQCVPFLRPTPPEPPPKRVTTFEKVAGLYCMVEVIE